MFNTDLFDKKQEDPIIPENTTVVFVADMFARDYLGGAELTTQALIDSAPENFGVCCVHTSKLTKATIESGRGKFWIFGNFATIDPHLIPEIVKNLRYAVLEYDYKFCKYRSPEKHFHETGTKCDCADSLHGKLVSAFLHAATTVFWMSEEQLKTYSSYYPFLEDPNQGSRQITLSSVFDHDTFSKISALNALEREKSGYAILKSSSWIKGYEDAKQYCVDNNLEYSEIENLTYEQTLDKLSLSKGFVYLPRGGDTCPRMVLEAQLLGCELITNDNVQHKKEFPFSEGNIEDIFLYLSGRIEHFWINILDDMDIQPRISGYTTTYNCIDQKYPYIQSIKSMLGFCEEVVVMDGGSTDGTFEALLTLAETEYRLVVKQNKVDWNAPRAAVEDGLQKARARSFCTQKYCWQQDSDEIVHEDHYQAIHGLCRQFPPYVDIISLPVVEYWGSLEKVRLDITPWKWRISRNKPNITHGIPLQNRKTDENGLLYATQGTDGCDYINSETFEPVPHASFYSPEVHEMRIAALKQEPNALKKYEDWFNHVVNIMPSVFHYSWLDIERKIYTYKNFWQTHWESLYNTKQEDTAENNMFFDKPWKDITAEEITAKAKELSENLGGWVFHSKVNFDTPTPSISIKKSQPGLMNESTKNTSNDL